MPQARVNNIKVDIMVKQRELSLNRSKSVCLVIGSKKQKEEVTRELEQEPLMCGQVETKEVQVDKWLGQYLSAGGLAHSVLKTVEA